MTFLYSVQTADHFLGLGHSYDIAMYIVIVKLEIHWSDVKLHMLCSASISGMDMEPFPTCAAGSDLHFHYHSILKPKKLHFAHALSLGHRL